MSNFPPPELAQEHVQESASPSSIMAMRSSKRREARDLQELQSRHEGTQGAHLSQETKMAVSQVQESPNAGAQAGLAINDQMGRRTIMTASR